MKSASGQRHPGEKQSPGEKKADRGNAARSGEGAQGTLLLCATLRSQCFALKNAKMFAKKCQMLLKFC